jgi:hypothetical protein
MPEPTGNDRTSIAAFIDIDHAGALLEILQVFAKNDVNLTFIQSRPTGRELGHYHFIIDVEGHIKDAPVGKSIEFAELVAIGRSHGESVIGYRTLANSKNDPASGVNLNPAKTTVFKPAAGDGLVIIGDLN